MRLNRIRIGREEESGEANFHNNITLFEKLNWKKRFCQASVQQMRVGSIHRQVI